MKAKLVKESLGKFLNESFSIDEKSLADLIMDIGGSGVLYSGPSKMKDSNLWTAELDVYGTLYSLDLNIKEGVLELTEFIDEDNYNDYEEEGFYTDSDGNPMPTENQVDVYVTEVKNKSELEEALINFFKRFDVEWNPKYPKPRAFR